MLNRPLYYYPLTAETQLQDVSGYGRPDLVAPGWQDFTFATPKITFGNILEQPAGLKPDTFAVPPLTGPAQATLDMPAPTTAGIALIVLPWADLPPLATYSMATLTDATERTWRVLREATTGDVVVTRSGVEIARRAGRWDSQPVVVRWDYVSAVSTKVTIGSFPFDSGTYAAGIPRFTTVVLAEPTQNVGWQGIGHFALFGTALSTDEAFHLNYASLGTGTDLLAAPDFAGSWTLKRAARMAGYLADDWIVEPLAEDFGAINGKPFAGQKPVDALRGLVVAQPGVLLESPSGALVHQAYTHRLSAPVWLTLDVANGNVAAGLKLAYSDQGMVNDATVKSLSGSARYVDQGSVTAHGQYASQVDSPATYTNNLRPVDYAASIVNQRGVPEVRVAAVKLNLHAPGMAAVRTAWLRQQIRNLAFFPGDNYPGSTFAGMKSLTNCVVVQESTVVNVGPKSAKATVTAAGAWGVVQYLDPWGLYGQPVRVGVTYTAGFRSRAAVTARTITPVLRWLDKSGVLISDTTGAASLNSTSSWTLYSVTGAAPAGAVYAIIIANGVAAAAGEVHYYANRQLVTGATLPTYGDGDQVGWRWLGYPGLSDSYFDADPIGSVIRLLNPPKQLGVDATEMFVEGYRMTITPVEWIVELFVSAVGRMRRLWTLDDPGDLGREDTDGQTTSASALAGATSLQVASPAGGPLLSAAAGDYPVDLSVDGRKVTATACSGSSSPQTLTVAALPAAIPSGAAVQLWQPTYLAY